VLLLKGFPRVALDPRRLGSGFLKTKKKKKEKKKKKKRNLAHGDTMSCRQQSLFLVPVADWRKNASRHLKALLREAVATLFQQSQMHDGGRVERAARHQTHALRDDALGLFRGGQHENTSFC
jgi:hypothetical protein